MKSPNVLGLLSACPLLLACELADEAIWQPPDVPAPRAALRAPVIAPVGQPVVFDASASEIADDVRVRYVFYFNDGSEPVESEHPIAEHVFHSARLYAVRLLVIDNLDQSSTALQDVAVRNDYPAVADFCDVDEDCVIGDECVLGVCYATGGSLD